MIVQSMQLHMAFPVSGAGEQHLLFQWILRSLRSILRVLKHHGR